MAVRFGDLRIGSLLFADDVVPMLHRNRDLQLSLERFATECEAAGMGISTFKSEAMVIDRKRVECNLLVGEKIFTQAEEFKYLGINRQIGAASAVMGALHGGPALVHRGEKRAQSKGEALYLPFDLCSYPHLWSQTMGSDREYKRPK